MTSLIERSNRAFFMGSVQWNTIHRKYLGPHFHHLWQLQLSLNWSFMSTSIPSLPSLYAFYIISLYLSGIFERENLRMSAFRKIIHRVSWTISSCCKKSLKPLNMINWTQISFKRKTKSYLSVVCWSSSFSIYETIWRFDKSKLWFTAEYTGKMNDKTFTLYDSPPS